MKMIHWRSLPTHTFKLVNLSLTVFQEDKHCYSSQTEQNQKTNAKKKFKICVSVLKMKKQILFQKMPT